MDGKESYYWWPNELPLSLGETVGQQRRREHKNLKWFVMFIIAILGLVVSIVGIVVPVITTRQGQPHQNSSGMAFPD